MLQQLLLLLEVVVSPFVVRRIGAHSRAKRSPAAPPGAADSSTAHQDGRSAPLAAGSGSVVPNGSIEETETEVTP